MAGYKLFSGTRGIFNAMRYEISKETGIETDLRHIDGNNEKGMDETIINKIIELSEK